MVELDFLKNFLPYSFRLIGTQTKQGYIHPWSVKIGLNMDVVNDLSMFGSTDGVTFYLQGIRKCLLKSSSIITA